MLIQTVTVVINNTKFTFMYWQTTVLFKKHLYTYLAKAIILHSTRYRYRLFLAVFGECFMTPLIKQSHFGQVQNKKVIKCYSGNNYYFGESCGF
jgi:hypothetical protein